MPEALSYAAVLRLIGQMLEALRIESFAVMPDGEGFIVRDQTRHRAQLTPRERAFLAQLHEGHAASVDRGDALRLAGGVLEWHLTEGDLERLEQQGRQRRRDGESMPDSHSISQMLRVIGAILDHRRARMVQVAKDDHVITVEYAGAGGHQIAEEYSAPMLYDCWVRLYKKRSGSAQLSA